MNKLERNRPIYNALPDLFNLTEYLFLRNRKNASKAAIVTKKNTYSYADLKYETQKFACFCKTLGLSEQDRLAIILPDGFEFIIAFLGAIAGGIVPVLINELLGVQLITLSVIDSKPRAIITTLKILNKIQKNLDEQIEIILVEDLLEQLFHMELKGSFSFKPTRKSDLAFIAYTSGSTGEPKGVMHAQYSPIVACINYAERSLQLTQEDKFLSGPPLAFTYGLGTSLYMPFYLGATTLICKKKDPFSLIEAINCFQPTVFFGVPSHYAGMLSIEAIEPLKKNSLRLCVSAGERLSPLLWRRWYEYSGLKICEGIGTTESTHIFISNCIDRPIPGSSGQVVNGYVAKLVNQEGQEVEAVNEAGSLLITGEGFFLGYWGKREETEKALKNEGLLLKDIYRRDQEGNYYFISRQDDLIKLNGLWIFPPEIEECALEVTGIKKAVVVPINSSLLPGLAEIVLFVEVDKNSDSEVQVMKRLRECLPKFKVPKKIISVTHFPLSATGKIDRKKLCSTYLNKESEKCA